MTHFFPLFQERDDFTKQDKEIRELSFRTVIIYILYM